MSHESEILKIFETTSDTSFLPVNVRELGWICTGMIQWHVF